MMNIDEYMELSEALDSELPTAEEYTDTVAKLERKFANLNLKFTAPFQSAFPMFAEGELQGKFFTFKIRRDIVWFRFFNESTSTAPTREVMLNGATGNEWAGILDPDEAEIVFGNVVNSLIWE